jgi:hypothetical protein
VEKTTFTAWISGEVVAFLLASIIIITVILLGVRTPTEQCGKACSVGVGYLPGPGMLRYDPQTQLCECQAAAAPAVQPEKKAE